MNASNLPPGVTDAMLDPSGPRRINKLAKGTEPGRKADETPMEYLRRLVSNCDMEPESTLDDLPSVQAVLEYFGLWHIYDTDFIDGVIECIEEGDDARPYLAFVRKWGLAKKGWRTSFKRRRAAQP